MMYVYRVFIAAMAFLPALTGESWAKKGSPAGIKCAVETTTLVSVTIGNINKAPTMTNTLSFSCSIRNAIAANQQMVYCWHIHDSSSGNTPFTYRYATLGTGRNQSKIGFNIYSNGTRVGDRKNAYNITGYSTKVNDLLYRVDDPMTVRFEGNEGVSLPEGKYIYNNPRTHVVMHTIEPGDALDYPNACGAKEDNGGGDIVDRGQIMGNTIVDINVRTYCDVKVGSDMVFPRQFDLKNPVNTQAQVVVNCSAGTDYQVTLDNGQNYSDNMRHMKRSGGEELVSYNVTPESWSDLGTSFDQPFTVAGEVPAQATPPIGTYRDTVVVTVNIIQ
ncbi:MAG: spore coat U domain-containing protein [Candidatus Tokpelaia sp.]|nr:MAG: spore coat U domain-containing protein [Candidatus Tokpelaia sp.]KAA6207405.1 MAG: spore coat U domain-containing protein [Candidatus Tokpelaia sp.]